LPRGALPQLAHAILLDNIILIGFHPRFARKETGRILYKSSPKVPIKLKEKIHQNLTQTLSNIFY
jgi:hypothetical protein